MSGRLKNELKQTKPFTSKEVEAMLNLVRTTELLVRAGSDLLKESNLSGQQYNVLRILRGAAPEALACHEIGERMISRDPDLTRLLDRMERDGLVKRVRGEKDRRVVLTRITDAGLALCERLIEPMEQLHRKQLGHLGGKKLETLIALLEEVRSGNE
jgi:DNA-binding MarR family transcriptional regulator